MEHPHPLAVHAENKEAFERVGEGFILADKLKETQTKTWKVARLIRQELKEGMTEAEARRLCMYLFKSHGVTKHWHRPYVRFGPGTLLNFHHPDHEHRLKTNDPVYFDLGPVWPDEETGLEYEGDVGDGFAFGKNEPFEHLRTFTRSVFNDCQNYWNKEQVSGSKLYERAEAICKESPYALVKDVIGHRVSDFPHQKYSKESLNSIRFTPEKGLWIFEIHILDTKNRMGCFIENSLGDPLPE